MTAHALEGMPDHTHLFLETDSRWAPAQFAAKIKATHPGYYGLSRRICASICLRFGAALTFARRLMLPRKRRAGATSKRRMCFGMEKGPLWRGDRRPKGALAQSWCKQRLYSGCESVTEMTHRGVINLGRKNHTCAICVGRRRGFDGSRSDHDTGQPKGEILLLSRLPTTVGQRSQPL